MANGEWLTTSSNRERVHYFVAANKSLCGIKAIGLKVQGKTMVSECKRCALILRMQEGRKCKS